MYTVIYNNTSRRICNCILRVLLLCMEAWCILLCIAIFIVHGWNLHLTSYCGWWGKKKNEKFKIHTIAIIWLTKLISLPPTIFGYPFTIFNLHKSHFAFSIFYSYKYVQMDLDFRYVCASSVNKSKEYI